MEKLHNVEANNVVLLLWTKKCLLIFNLLLKKWLFLFRKNFWGSDKKKDAVSCEVDNSGTTFEIQNFLFPVFVFFNSKLSNMFFSDWFWDTACLYWTSGQTSRFVHHNFLTRLQWHNTSFYYLETMSEAETPVQRNPNMLIFQTNRPSWTTTHNETLTAVFFFCLFFFYWSTQQSMWMSV